MRILLFGHIIRNNIIGEKWKIIGFNYRYHPSLQAGSSRHPAWSVPRGLPSTSDPHPPHSSHPHPRPHHHTGEKRKTRPPSLSHDSDDDVQIVGHHYSTGASQPRRKIIAHEKRDFGRQPGTHVSGEAGPSSRHDRHREGGIQPSEASGLLGHHSPTTTKDQSRHMEYDPDRYGSSSHSRHVGMEQFSTREPQEHQHRQYQTKSHQLDPHVNSSNKKHKHKGERGVHFQQWAKLTASYKKSG